MRKLWSVLAFVLVISLAVGPVADAGVQWCEDDPIVTVDGRRFEMVTGVPQENLASLVGPIHYFVAVPQGAVVTVVYPPAAIPSKVTILRVLRPTEGDEMTVKVAVHVRATESFEFRTRVFGPAIKEPFEVFGQSQRPKSFEVRLLAHP